MSSSGDSMRWACASIVHANSIAIAGTTMARNGGRNVQRRMGVTGSGMRRRRGLLLASDAGSADRLLQLRSTQEARRARRSDAQNEKGRPESAFVDALHGSGVT